MKDFTRDHSDADMAYVRLKSGERPFKPYGETLALPGVNTRPVPSRRIPANEGTTAAYTDLVQKALGSLNAAPVKLPSLGENIVRLSDARSQRKAPGR